MPATRITHADWQVTEAPGFREPSIVMDSRALPDTWQPIELPLSLPIALLRQADDRFIASATRTTWLRVAVHDLPVTTGPLALYGVRIKTDGTIAVYADGRLVHHRSWAQQPPVQAGATESAEVNVMGPVCGLDFG